AALDKAEGSGYPESMKLRALAFALVSPALAAAAAPNIAPPLVPGSPAVSDALDGHKRDALIAAGVIASLAMFLWDRRRKG
ncbi:MAG TPA: hypothetical protein VH309_05415, partial [Elusimicrobiota bacterium]|nr:hypothetical protein [Elusimicrobiota bacterium]